MRSLNRDLVMSESNTADAKKSDFEELKEEDQLTIIQEFMLFVVENKAWWLVPILLVLSLVGVLVALGSTGAMPFIYTFF